MPRQQPTKKPFSPIESAYSTAIEQLNNGYSLSSCGFFPLLYRIDEKKREECKTSTCLKHLLPMQRIFRKEKERIVYNWHEYCAHWECTVCVCECMERRKIWMLSMSSRSTTMYYQIVRSSAIDWYLTIIEGKLYGFVWCGWCLCKHNDCACK